MRSCTPKSNRMGIVDVIIGKQSWLGNQAKLRDNQLTISRFLKRREAVVKTFILAHLKAVEFTL